MIVLLRFLILFFMILTINLQEGQPLNTPSTGPGISLCVHDHNDDRNCTLNDLSVDVLPETCTAFVFEYLSVSLDLNVQPTYSDDDNERLDMLCKKGKNVYVNYGRMPGHWEIVLACMACDQTIAKEESKNINLYLKAHPGITGFILRNLDAWPQKTKQTVGYNENVLKYIETIKQETGLEIGISLLGDLFQYYYENSKLPWLDFSVLDKYVDLYVIDLFSYFNPCTFRLKYGVLPKSGYQDKTLTKLQSIILKSGIPKEKLYFKFILFPLSNGSGGKCKVNFQEMCISPLNSTHWCSDTQQTYFQKGQWAKENGAGFIGASLNFDDPLNCCNCGPNPAFNAILAGINGSASIPSCPLFDRC